MHVPARACSDLLSPLVKDGSRRLGRAWDGTLGRWAEWPSLALGGGGTGGGVRRAVYGHLLLGAPTRASARTRASRRLAGGGEPRSYRPAGWRAMKPAGEVMLSDQREPVSASATVSKRLDRKSTRLNSSHLGIS